MGVDDRIDLDTAGQLLSGNEPMAVCPRDGDPLVMTMEFSGAEFFCVTCEGKFGFLAPTPATWTPELQARHDELKATYDEARAARDFERYGERCDAGYEWPPVSKVSDHERSELRADPGGSWRPFLDGRWVTTTIYEKFNAEWSAYYTAHPEEHEHPEGVNLCSVPECPHYKDTVRG